MLENLTSIQGESEPDGASESGGNSGDGGEKDSVHSAETDSRAQDVGGRVREDGEVLRLQAALSQAEEQNQLLNREYSQLLKEKEVSETHCTI